MDTKRDTNFGQLINLAFEQRYGEGFEWTGATITKDGSKNYTVSIDTDTQRRINPAIICLQYCKNLKTVATEDGEAVYCDFDGECPLGKRGV